MIQKCSFAVYTVIIHCYFEKKIHFTKSGRQSKDWGAWIMVLALFLCGLFLWFIYVVLYILVNKKLMHLVSAML